MGLLQVGLGRGQKGRDRDPGQQDGGRSRRAARPGVLVASAGPGAERVRQGDRRDAAAERRNGKQGEAAAADDHRRGAQTRPRGDAEQVRIGQRVAEHSLVGGAAASQHRADKRAKHYPGQPDLPDDRRVKRRRRDSRMPGQMSGERVGDRAKRYGDRADGDPGDQRDEQNGCRGYDGRCGPAWPAGRCGGPGGPAMAASDAPRRQWIRGSGRVGGPARQA